MVGRWTQGTHCELAFIQDSVCFLAPIILHSSREAMLLLQISIYHCQFRPCVQKPSKGLGIPLSPEYSTQVNDCWSLWKKDLGIMTEIIAAALPGSLS